MLSEI